MRAQELHRNVHKNLRGGLLADELYVDVGPHMRLYLFALSVVVSELRRDDVSPFRVQQLELSRGHPAIELAQMSVPRDGSHLSGVSREDRSACLVAAPGDLHYFSLLSGGVEKASLAA